MTFFNFVKPFIPAVLPLFNKTLFKLWWFSIKHFNVSSSLLCASSSCHTNYICPWEFYFIRIKTNFNSHLFFNLLHLPKHRSGSADVLIYTHTICTRMNPMNHLAKSAKWKVWIWLFKVFDGDEPKYILEHASDLLQTLNNLLTFNCGYFNRLGLRKWFF